MTREELYEIVTEMIQTIGTGTFINDICDAMNTDDLETNLRWIDRMRDTNIFND